MTARHFLEIKDAKLLKTQPFLRAQRVVSDCLSARAVGVVHGLAGLGKTFAVDSASAGADVDVHWFTFARRPAQTALVKGMLRELTGIEPSGEVFRLTDELLDVLGEKPRLLVVDEAQQLTADTIEFLRFLHDDRRTDFALVLAGGNGCWKVISRYPMLRSRIYREYEMRPLSEAEVLSLIPKYHPVHAGADADTILMINEDFAGGTLRLWASFTATVNDLCTARKVHTYDDKIALAALELLPDWGMAA